MTVKELTTILAHADDDDEVFATDLYGTDETFPVASFSLGVGFINLTNKKD